MANSKLKCRGCSERFLRESMQRFGNGNYCTIECATTYAREKGLKQKAKEQRKKDRERKKEFKENDARHQVKLTQKSFNKLIRLRDEKEGCISCGRMESGQFHAGHWKTTAARPDLRFNELNVHKQCSNCNLHLSGNVGEYRKRLIKKIGLEQVEKLECEPKERKKYTCEELIVMRKEFNRQIREIESEAS